MGYSTSKTGKMNDFEKVVQLHKEAESKWMLPYYKVTPTYCKYTIKKAKYAKHCMKVDGSFLHSYYCPDNDCSVNMKMSIERPWIWWYAFFELNSYLPMKMVKEEMKRIFPKYQSQQ